MADCRLSPVHSVCIIKHINMFKVSNNKQCLTIYKQWPLGFQHWEVIDFKENTVSLEDSYSRLYVGMYTVTWSDHKP